jgi:hypothetical protein
MRHKRTRIHCLSRGCWLALLLAAVWAAQCVQAADVHLSSLKIGTDVFTNVTVYQTTDTDIFVRHERGFGNAKISNLDDPTLILLGLKTPKTDSQVAAASTGNGASMEKVMATLAAVNLKLPQESSVLRAISRTKPTPQLLAGVLAGMFIGYLFYCYCIKKVCLNAGCEPGVLVWLPIVQMFELLRAARMPAWWFVIFLIPGLNVFALVIWAVRITRLCGKGLLVALLLILPLTNILAFLYLAFSSGKEQPVEKSFKAEDLPGLAGA